MAVVTSLPDIKRYIRMRQMQPGEPLSPDTAVAVGRAGDGHHGRGTDATRMCDVAPRRRSAVWEAMPTRAEG